MKPVRLLGRKDSTVLVEWTESGELLRSFVPVDQIQTREDGTKTCAHPEQGIPYGLPWAMIVPTELDPKLFELELHKRGIWTYEDFQKNPQTVISSLQKVLKHTIVELRHRILDFQGE